MTAGGALAAERCTNGALAAERCTNGALAAERRISIPRVAGMRSFERSFESGVRGDLGLRGANTALRFDAGESAVRQRTGQPVPSRKRLPGVENRRNLRHDRQA
jgi:hypothetical protein